MVLLFNMGVPMIMPTMFFMVLALVPIVLIETFYLARRLGISFSSAVGSVAYANVISTIVGLPFTWFVLFLIQIVTGGTSRYDLESFSGKVIFVTLQAPWLPPLDHAEFWVFHGAALFLLIPFFFATWLIEYLVMTTKLVRKIVETHPTIEFSAAGKMLSQAVRNANLLSYGLIAMLLILSLILSAVSLR